MEKKLEIGSGNKPREGYIHFDIRKIDGVDFIGDARKLPFDEGEFSEVYSRFFLEHLNRNDASLVLKEMYRVLAKNGLLQIIVPNIAYFCKVFIEESGQKKEWALNKIYGFENYKEDHHYYGYDEETLTKLLKEIGFAIIKRENAEDQYLHMTARKV